MISALQNDLECARHWLEAGADVNNEPGFGAHPPLLSAVSNCNLLAVQLVLQYGADVAFKMPDNQNTALHLAASLEDTMHSVTIYDICKLLMENGANCNEQNSSGVTPFLCALEHNNVQVIELFATELTWH